MSTTVSAVTQGIRVEVRSEYSPSRSAPQNNHWFFLYTIQITNDGDAPAKLMSRRWVITNARGEVSEVEGPGVVGEHPHLGPGESFTYTSACPLDTSFGTMAGSYEMARDDGTRFEARVPTFSLAMPFAIN
ncbi:MAG: Co2+/Mg2+ efflux protein ApaG [Myxococcales bacterium]|nr:Co2+/Mg2+ efflux protein ApaG [Myxococcales bacterium]MCB9519346.1 Co2+/Mg2+ efflux protein ApaG [Myxococcales bacterium]